jgi:hypothetical protein
MHHHHHHHLITFIKLLQAADRKESTGKFVNFINGLQDKFVEILQLADKSGSARFRLETGCRLAAWETFAFKTACGQERELNETPIPGEQESPEDGRFPVTQLKNALDGRLQASRWIMKCWDASLSAVSLINQVI